MIRSRSSLFAAVLVATGLAHVSLAQECIGLPADSRATLTVGFEGTDGATGSGLGFAYQRGRSSLSLQHQSLDGFTMVDVMRTTGLRLSRRLARGWACALAGVEWTAYDNDRTEATSWSASDPDHIYEQIREGGQYNRFRVPGGLALGHQFGVGRLAFIPNLALMIVHESERYTGPGPLRRSTTGGGWSTGLTIANSWLVVRWSVSDVRTTDYSLSNRNNFLTLSVQAGVKY